MPHPPDFDLAINTVGTGYTVQVQAAFGVGELPPQPFAPPLDLAQLPHRRGDVPAVIAMQFEIAEDSARELSRVFFAELAAGAPVDLALTEARMHLYGYDHFQLDWVIPVLFMRSDDGALFEVTSQKSVDESNSSPPTEMPQASYLPPPQKYSEMTDQSQRYESDKSSWSALPSSNDSRCRPR